MYSWQSCTQFVSLCTVCKRTCVIWLGLGLGLGSGLVKKFASWTCTISKLRSTFCKLCRLRNCTVNMCCFQTLKMPVRVKLGRRIVNLLESRSSMYLRLYNLVIYYAILQPDTLSPPPLALRQLLLHPPPPSQPLVESKTLSATILVTWSPCLDFTLHVIICRFTQLSFLTNVLSLFYCSTVILSSVVCLFLSSVQTLV